MGFFCGFTKVYTNHHTQILNTYMATFCQIFCVCWSLDRCAVAADATYKNIGKLAKSGVQYIQILDIVVSIYFNKGD